MSVDPLGSTSSNGINPYPSSNGLTGDAMMIYLSTQLGDMDGDIQGFMDEQQAIMKKKEVYQHFRSWAAKSQAKDNANATAEWSSYINSLPPGSPEVQTANQLAGDFIRQYDPDGDGGIVTSEKQFDAVLADLDNKISGLNKDGELKMIRLQQLMTQRQTAIQLATNMMNKFGEGMNAIVGNIR
ncbi:MAG: hypothetical protein RJA70_2744 [Pseudomonadota bacterium]|jgi:hypothetical protein